MIYPIFIIFTGWAGKGTVHRSEWNLAVDGEPKLTKFHALSVQSVAIARGKTEKSTSEKTYIMTGKRYTRVYGPCSRAVNTDRKHGRHFWTPENTASVNTCDTLVTNTAHEQGCHF